MTAAEKGEGIEFITPGHPESGVDPNFEKTKETGESQKPAEIGVIPSKPKIDQRDVNPNASTPLDKSLPGMEQKVAGALNPQDLEAAHKENLNEFLGLAKMAEEAQKNKVDISDFDDAIHRP